MRSEKAVFCQVMDWVHGEQFRRCVSRYQGNYRVRNFSCWDQFLAMSFAQLTYRDMAQHKQLVPTERIGGFPVCAFPIGTLEGDVIHGAFCGVLEPDAGAESAGADVMNGCVFGFC